ncbi:MAG: hypothetical protein JWR63_2516 [Conexibacter sp.]|nr:hypothetical protein [Conexibacter sp.]
MKPPGEAGIWFHSLHATSHALQPMQMLVSVKKPISGWRRGHRHRVSRLTTTGHARRSSAATEPGARRV